ncbi:MAG: AIR synthase-related protein [Nanoarchaeota archaeon]
MANRIEVTSKVEDMRANVRKKDLESRGFSGKIRDLSLVDAYTIDAILNNEEVKKVASVLSNPVFQKVRVNKPLAPKRFDYAIEIGFLPGVTDNVGNTARESIEDLLKIQLNGQTVYSSQVMFLSGDISRENALRIGESVANPLIQRIYVKSYDEFRSNNGMGIIIPKVRIREQPTADLVDILNAPEEELAVIGKQGIANSDGTRRGPLALDLTYMKTIREYFSKQGRNPTDIELESIAQTWSEHCKHTIFADPIDEIGDGLFKHYIKRATNEIRKAKRDKDFCASVFTDNSGAIIFDDKYLITHKVETHNSPSALDPFGGAETGIVGVNRDAIGFGLGGKPIANTYGFCFADPNDDSPLYKGPNKTQKMLSPRKIIDGVVAGVNAGGNQSGIPTPQGFVYFDERFKGKPLVFVGTVGLIPREVNERKMYEKKANPGDYIVMIGGRVGKDGIHGATFSSEAIDSDSPATAVQIGDPITQKKLSDAIVKEARDIGLYASITDNGAGGLSCSVAEMAKESGGCYVKLDKVPLKYPGLKQWEIWVSESQERMTLSVPKEKWLRFSELMRKRGVEASVIGEFTNSGRCIVDYGRKRVMDIKMDFLHNGLSQRAMKTTFTRQRHEEPDFSPPENLTQSLHQMLKRQNIASFEFISKQYDHEVQGGSVIKPLQGKGSVIGDATIIRPVLNSYKGIVISQGLYPSYSDIDTYYMATASIDTAIRNAVTTGAKLEQIALLDNFCWCSSNESERLGQLKRAALACYDTAAAYGTPFISGKDSMFNDFKGFDKTGTQIKISVPPTLLVSSIAVMNDVRKAVSLDAKMPGDLVYVIGVDAGELGGSEYFAMMGEQLKGERFIGNNVPKVIPHLYAKTYKDFSKAVENELVASTQSIHKGGLGIALAKTAMSGRLGIHIDLRLVKGNNLRDDFVFYSESQGRILITVASRYQEKFERLMRGTPFSLIGEVTHSGNLAVVGRDGKTKLNEKVDFLLDSYKSTFKNY